MGESCAICGCNLFPFNRIQITSQSVVCRDCTNRIMKREQERKDYDVVSTTFSGVEGL